MNSSQPRHAGFNSGPQIKQSQQGSIDIEVDTSCRQEADENSSSESGSSDTTSSDDDALLSESEVAKLRAEVMTEV